MKSSLFRRSAVNARFNKSGSSILITTAPSHRVVALIAGLLSVTILAFTAFGKVTRTVTVTGTLIPEHGLLRIYSPQPGVVIEKRFIFGDAVTRAQPLYILSSDRVDAGGASLVAQVSASVRDRIATLKETIEVTKGLHVEERSNLVRQHDDIIAQIAVATEQLQVSSQSVLLDKKIVDRKLALRLANILSVDPLEASQRQLTTDQAQFLLIKANLQKLAQAVADTDALLRKLPLTQANQIFDLKRQLAQTQTDLANNEMRREVVITASESGTISADLAEVGQTVTVGTPMAVIAPHDTFLEAHLLVPSSGIGFIRAGSVVALRYQAYPYQKFGTYDGHVVAVSEVALGPGEMESLRAPVEGNEPIYRVTVQLEKQTVDALGVQQPLKGGMLVDAEIGAETRRIFEWVFEPVYSMRGSVAFGGRQ